MIEPFNQASVDKRALRWVYFGMSSYIDIASIERKHMRCCGKIRLHIDNVLPGSARFSLDIVF